MSAYSTMKCIFNVVKETLCDVKDIFFELLYYLFTYKLQEFRRKEIYMNDTAPFNYDNILSAIARVSLVEKTSKAGNPYIDGQIYLLNGYSIRLGYIDNNQKQAIKDSLKLAIQNPFNAPEVEG